MRLKLRRGEEWQESRLEAAGYCFGGSSESSSSSSSNTTTTNIDRRQVVGEGAIGLASDQSTINVQAMDAGIVNKALDTIKAADATNGEGFGALLGLADKLFTGAGAVVSKTQDTALAQISALNTAANDSRGQIDQKTIVILGVAAAGVVAAYAMKKKG